MRKLTKIKFNLRKDAQNLTNDEVKNKLKTITQGQKSDKILGLMAMTFRAFCDLADWDSVGTEETNKIETPHVVLKSDNTEKSQTKTDPTTTDMNECVESAKVMATVYTAIAAFENMVRQFVVKILMENKGENWWTECVSDKIRKSADSRKAEEDKIKWHTHRGTSMINYVDFADLANIMGQNYDLFEVHIVSLEWAKQIFTTLEKSRNVIMHSGELGERDIERIGINIRDWISQVGA